MRKIGQYNKYNGRLVCCTYYTYTGTHTTRTNTTTTRYYTGTHATLVQILLKKKKASI